MQSNFSFMLMAFEFRLRDRRYPPVQILREAGVHNGMTVLDFGCGPGGFSIAASRLVGDQGRVYALDIQPLALEFARRAAKKENLLNISILTGDEINGIPEASVEMVLFYDILHDFAETVEVLWKIRRILKRNGILSVSDHHLQETAILSKITDSGLFIFSGRCQRSLAFALVDQHTVI